MLKQGAKLVISMGYLAVEFVDFSSSNPVAYVSVHRVMPETSAFQFSMSGFAHRLGDPLRHKENQTNAYETLDGKLDIHVNNQAVTELNEVVVVECPRVRAGTETRWNGRGWQALTRKEGWQYING